MTALTRAASRLAWTIWGVCTVMSLSAAILSYRIEAAGLTPERAFRFDGVIGIVFPLVGALIVSRRPDNRIAWLLTAIGVSGASGAYFPEYAQFANDVEPLPLSDLSLWIGGWVWIPFFALTLTFLLLLFPTGHLPSPAWRPVGWMAGLGIFLAGVSLSFMPYGAGESGYGANPYGVESLSGLLTVTAIVGGVLVGLGTVASVYSLFWRRKRSSSIERQQLKWFAYSAAMMPVAFVGISSLEEFVSFNPLPIDPTVIALLLPPAAMTAAILRHRLYDIDVVINRTLVYGALSAALLASYLLIVVTLSRVLDPVTRDSDIAVAASTLAVAALFGPLRARIQGFIDRRFYRAKYDAAAALDRFGARLRDEVDIELVRSDVLGVVADTMQPRHASLWLRGEGSVG